MLVLQRIWWKYRALYYIYILICDNIFHRPCDTNVDITFSAHDAFLELASSGTLQV